MRRNQGISPMEEKVTLPTPETEKKSSSTFSVTFNLLSQYLKENKSFSTIPGIPMPQKTMPFLPGVDIAVENEEEESRKHREIELFPQRAGFDNSDTANDTREPEKAKLTIFYGGKVLVFDDFPAEKAHDLMQYASKAQNYGPQESTIASKPAPATATPAQQQPSRVVQVTDMPMARRASLHRFLEKRKDRISSRAPYQAPLIKVKKEEEDSVTWLGLGPQVSFQCLNSESST